LNRYRTRIKFCGITSIEDANAAVAAGADAIGLVFHAQSKRYVSMEQAAEIASAVPAFVTVTALFVNPEPEFVRKVLLKTRLDLLQFHGEENEAFCMQFQRPYMKGCQLKSAEDIEKIRQAYSRSSALLLDSWNPEQPGGSGQTFDWGLLKGHTIQHLVLAGGLTPDNVGVAIQQVKPFAVDVSSGIESAPGRKSADLMMNFSQAVKRADAGLNQL
jgi:phosphoribosylanthranilate isomerase